MAYLRLHVQAGYFSIPADDGERLALELAQLGDHDAQAVPAGRLLLNNLSYGRPTDVELVALNPGTLKGALASMIASGASISDSTYALWQALGGTVL